MLTNTLFKLADHLDWEITENEDFIYGEYKGYLYSIMSGKNFTAIFSPVSALTVEDRDALYDWLLENESVFKIFNYEITENFLCLRLKEGIINRSYKSLIDIIERLSNFFDQIDLTKNACLVCGQEASEQEKGLYLDLFCYLHAKCEYREGFDVAVDAKESFHKGKERIPNEDRIEELAEKMKDYHSEFSKDLQEILSIASVKDLATEKAPYGQGTADALDEFIRIADKMGFKTKNLDYRAGYAEFGEGDQMIAALCHLDVVPADEGWESPPFEPRLINGKLYARGVADDKGPTMAVLYAMKALKDDGYEPPCRIRLIVGLDEENGFSCMDHYRQVEELPLAGFTADATFPAVFAEKGILRINFQKERQLQDEGIEIKSLKGGEAVNMVPQVCRYILQKDGEFLEEVKVEGKASHASRPELGDNAIVKALQKIKADYPEWDDVLSDLSQKYFNSHIYGDDFGIAGSDESGALTLNIALIEVSPDKIDLTFDIRYPITKSGSEIAAILDKKMQDLAFDSCQYKDEAPLDLGKESGLVTTVMDVYNTAMGSNDEAVAMGGGTYARAIPNILAFGAVFPGTPDCMHQVDEHASLKHLYAASYIYKETLRALAEKQR